MELSFSHVISQISVPVWCVIVTLAVMVLWSLYVLVERILALSKAGKQSRALAEAIGKPLAAGDAAGALAIAKKAEFEASYLGHMLIAGLTEFVGRPDRHGIDSVGRALERTSINEGQDLRRGIAILATTGSTAPFVGLVGTIFGIINAFGGMAETGGGGIAGVSAGIAEALVTTAIGIVIAIIGVWCYNFFNGWIERITNDMTVSSQELIDWAEKQVLPPFDASAKH
jgi:biopolymer transport protein ExbB/TolQ